MALQDALSAAETGLTGLGDAIAIARDVDPASPEVAIAGVAVTSALAGIGLLKKKLAGEAVTDEERAAARDQTASLLNQLHDLLPTGPV